MSAALFIHLEDAVSKATRASHKDGRLRYILCTGLGYSVSLRKPDDDCYWTNGEHGGSWSYDHRSGIRDSLIEDMMPAKK